MNKLIKRLFRKFKRKSSNKIIKDEWFAMKKMLAEVKLSNIVQQLTLPNTAVCVIVFANIQTLLEQNVLTQHLLKHNFVSKQQSFFRKTK